MSGSWHFDIFRQNMYVLISDNSKLMTIVENLSEVGIDCPTVHLWNFENLVHSENSAQDSMKMSLVCSFWYSSKMPN